MAVEITNFTVELSGVLLEQLIYFIDEIHISGSQKLTINEVVEMSIQHFFVAYKHRKKEKTIGNDNF